MSAFYDLASLVVVPSGYKASKVYAQKPLTTDGQLTFSRASTATRVGPDGLIEKVRTNLALYSQDFSQTGTWVTSTTTRADSQTDPNGGTTASKFTATGANSNVIQTLTVSSGIPYTWSFYAKSDSATDVNIRLDNNNGNFVQANMALTTSWQRFSITLNSNATTILCYIGGGVSFTAGEVAYMAFAQLEASDIVTDYIATTSAAVSVGPLANVPRLDYLGSSCPRLLLEPQRTNLIQYSEQFNNAWWAGSGSVIANTATSPDGTLSADTNNPTGVYPAAAGVGDATIVNTASIFAKANPSGASTMVLTLNKYGTGDSIVCTFNLTTGTAGAVTLGGSAVSGTAKIENYGNGWYRCILTGIASASAGALSFSPANNCFIWGAQVEAGAYATSYIPTLGAAVTRGADAAVKTGISALIGQTEGTLFMEFNSFAASYPLSVLCSVTKSDASKRAYAEINGSMITMGFVGSAANSATSTIVSGTNKVAIAYKNGDIAFYHNGVLKGTGAANVDWAGAVDIFNASGLYFFSPTYAYNEKEELKQALVFKTRLTNAQLAELTTL
jgi:hypothetical protein